MSSFPHSEPKMGSHLVIATFGQLRTFYSSEMGVHPPVIPPFLHISEIEVFIWWLNIKKKGAMQFVLGWVKCLS